MPYVNVTSDWAERVGRIEYHIKIRDPASGKLNKLDSGVRDGEGLKNEIAAEIQKGNTIYVFVADRGRNQYYFLKFNKNGSVVKIMIIKKTIKDEEYIFKTENIMVVPTDYTNCSGRVLLLSEAIDLQDELDKLEPLPEMEMGASLVKAPGRSASSVAEPGTGRGRGESSVNAPMPQEKRERSRDRPPTFKYNPYNLPVLRGEPNLLRSFLDDVIQQKFGTYQPKFVFFRKKNNYETLYSFIVLRASAILGEKDFFISDEAFFFTFEPTGEIIEYETTLDDDIQNIIKVKFEKMETEQKTEQKTELIRLLNKYFIEYFDNQKINQTDYSGLPRPWRSVPPPTQTAPPQPPLQTAPPQWLTNFFTNGGSKKKKTTKKSRKQKKTKRSKSSKKK